MASVASADVRSGSVADPVGDSTGGASRDITRFTASYDTNGRIYGTVEFAGNYDPAQPTFVSLRFASIDGPRCGGVGASLFGFQDSADPLFMIDGVRGTGRGFGTQLGASSVSFTATHALLGGKDWKCATVAVSPRGGDGSASDELSAPLYFDGFAPDADGDGVPDSRDACPAAAAPGTPDGCVPAAVPVQPPAAPPAPVPAGGPSKGPGTRSSLSVTAKPLAVVRRGKAAKLQLTVTNGTAAVAKGVKVVVRAPKGVTLGPGKRTSSKTIVVGRLAAGKSKALGVLTVNPTKKAKKTSSISLSVERSGGRPDKSSVVLRVR